MFDSFGINLMISLEVVMLCVLIGARLYRGQLHSRLNAVAQQSDLISTSGPAGLWHRVLISGARSTTWISRLGFVRNAGLLHIDGQRIVLKLIKPVDGQTRYESPRSDVQVFWPTETPTQMRNEEQNAFPFILQAAKIPAMKITGTGGTMGSVDVFHQIAPTAAIPILDGHRFKFLSNPSVRALCALIVLSTLLLWYDYLWVISYRFVSIPDPDTFFTLILVPSIVLSFAVFGFLAWQRLLWSDAASLAGVAGLIFVAASFPLLNRVEAVTGTQPESIVASVINPKKITPERDDWPTMSILWLGARSVEFEPGQRVSVQVVRGSFGSVLANRHTVTLLTKSSTTPQ